MEESYGLTIILLSYSNWSLPGETTHTMSAVPVIKLAPQGRREDGRELGPHARVVERRPRVRGLSESRYFGVLTCHSYGTLFTHNTR